jgi:selenocysteine-specific elongation factor
VERREVVDVGTLRAIGVPDSGRAGSVVRAGRWLMSADRAERAVAEMLQVIAAHDRARPLERGLPLAVLAEALGLPSPGLVEAVLREPLHLVGGRVLASHDDRLPEEVEQALAALTRDLAEHPFAAPPADRLRELGLEGARGATAAKAGRLLRLAPGVVLLPDAVQRAVDVLGDLPQPFTASEARTRLGSSRRVTLPLLQLLDREGVTRRLPDDRRVLVKSE